VCHVTKAGVRSSSGPGSTAVHARLRSRPSTFTEDFG
jgi:hypothetical protein